MVDRSADPDVIAQRGELLRQRLGSSFAEYWFDDASSQLAVGITDARQAAVARALGADPRVVTRNADALAAAMARLDALSANVPASVTGWYVDVTTNSVVVSVLGSDPAGAAFAAAAGDGVRIEQVAEAPVLYWSIIGGQAITVSGSRCSAGFNARSPAGVRYVITAGHCTNLGTNWNGTGGTIGTRAGTSFPGNDYGIIRVTTPPPPRPPSSTATGSCRTSPSPGRPRPQWGPWSAGRARRRDGVAGSSRARTRP